MKTIRKMASNRLTLILEHFFNKGHKECILGGESSHAPVGSDGKVAENDIRAGHYITCPAMQQDLEYHCRRKLGLLHLDRPHGLWSDGVGLVTTNLVETIIGYIAHIRKKAAKYLAEENRELEELGIVMQQAVRLGRLGVDFYPKVEILRSLETSMGFPEGSILDARTEILLKRDLMLRVKKAEAQSTDEYSKKRSSNKFAKRLSGEHVEGSNAADQHQGGGTFEDNFDNVDATSVSSQPKKTRKFKCGECGRLNHHNKTTCPLRLVVESVNK